MFKLASSIPSETSLPEGFSTRQCTYLSISSEGYGHSSRALALAQYFPPDELLIGTYGIALERLTAGLPGHRCVAIPQEIKFVGKAGSFDVGQTVFQNQAKALTFGQIVQDEMDLMQEHRVSLVVADGRMASVVAASRLRLPCLVLTNQSAFYPFFNTDSPLIRLLGLSFDLLMKFWLSSAEEILIPDFPPPYTICLPNLSTKNDVKKRTRFCGPLVAWQADAITPVSHEDRRPSIVVSVGGHAYRRPLLEAMLKVAPAFPDYRFDVLCSFTTGSFTLPNNVFMHHQVSQAAPYFKAARLVITQAGHSTAMELLTLGKPAIIVPDTKQTEQENNARRMRELGVARVLGYDKLEQLASVLQDALDDQSLEAQAARFSAMAKDLNGAARTAGLLKEYAGRLSAY